MGVTDPARLRGFEKRPLRLPRRFVTLWSKSLKPIQSVTSNHLVRFKSTSPRKNLPPSISRKRAEANFLCSFERAFVARHCQTKQITWRDFALQGYGIPDLITFAWSTQQNQATVWSLEALRQKLQRQQFTAFELKLRDWRKALYRRTDTGTDTGTSATAQSLSFPEMLPIGPLSGVDFTFSVPKSVSMYLARTKDAEVEKLIHQALRGGCDPSHA